MADLRSIDPDWEAWFDSDAVPEYGSEKGRALLVEARVREIAKSKPSVRPVARLYRGVFIWRDPHGCFLFDESHRIFEFINEAEARGHVDATLAASAALNTGALLGALA
jgi:hypothetical protein